MKARAVADAPPVISSMTPRSHVTSATAVIVRAVAASLISVYSLIIDEEINAVVKKTCRCMLKGSCGKKNCSMIYVLIQ